MNRMSRRVVIAGTTATLSDRFDRMRRAVRSPRARDLSHLPTVPVTWYSPLGKAR